MNNVSTYLKTLVRESHKTESEILSLAVEAGLRQLWRESILGQYLRNELSRDRAIEQVGIDYVELADRQSQAVMEDLAWAMNE